MEPFTSLTRLADGLAARGLDARENEPYQGTPEGLTSWLREDLAEDRYVGIELEAQQARVERASERGRFVEALVAATRDVLGALPAPTS